MLSSIHPLGERARGNRFNHTATAFVVGSAAGGATIGAAIGGLGWLTRQGPTDLSRSTALALVALAGVVAIFLEVSGKKLPSVGRQVNEDWLAEFRGWVYGIGFGFQLGAGVATYITSAAVFVWLVAMLISGSIVSAVVIGVAFGLVRGLTIMSTRSVQSPDQLMQFHRQLHRSAPLVRRLGTVALVFVTLAAGILATGTISS